MQYQSSWNPRYTNPLGINTSHTELTMALRRKKKKTKRKKFPSVFHLVCFVVQPSVVCEANLFITKIPDQALLSFCTRTKIPWPIWSSEDNFVLP
jgi:hypothetical protein